MNKNRESGLLDFFTERLGSKACSKSQGSNISASRCVENRYNFDTIALKAFNKRLYC